MAANKRLARAAVPLDAPGSPIRLRQPTAGPIAVPSTGAQLRRPRVQWVEDPRWLDVPTDIASSGSSDALGVHEPRRCALRGRRRRVEKIVSVFDVYSMGTSYSTAYAFGLSGVLKA